VRRNKGKPFDRKREVTKKRETRRAVNYWMVNKVGNQILKRKIQSEASTSEEQMERTIRPMKVVQRVSVETSGVRTQKREAQKKLVGEKGEIGKACK